MYKCSTDGKVSYGDRPCTNATGTATEMKVAAPERDMETMARMARQIALAQQLTNRDDARALREEQAAERAQRSAASRKVKCDRLRLRQRWANEDVRAAAPKKGAAASIKARRQMENMALECPN
ncbi:MAG: DUF4124 domain-containing protein [Pseudomonadota bacterium]|nr:DUF4124 domain-containing protein [Pseudomonadota bacterium]